jgi:hypothetical protein
MSQSCKRARCGIAKGRAIRHSRGAAHGSRCRNSGVVLARRDGARAVATHVEGTRNGRDASEGSRFERAKRD